MENSAEMNLENKIGNVLRYRFDKIPKYNRKRIFGVEIEYGTIGLNKPNLKEFKQNGSFLYIDLQHLEYCTPETTNPLETVIYEKAGEEICKEYVSGLIKNNVDSRGNTFGTHENYFTKSDHEELMRIVPFLATRQIYSGAGNIDIEGKYQISQRSSFIVNISSSNTTKARPILNTKMEPLSKVPGWIRFHLIVGDANMCEIANFLKIGTTGLMIDLVEDKKFPNLHYDVNKAVHDIQNISLNHKKWKIKGSRVYKNAIDIQKKCLESAAKHYEGRDDITDTILVSWDRTLKLLDKNIEALFGSIDWVTKKTLIDKLKSKKRFRNLYSEIREINYMYHDTNKEKSIFYELQRGGKIDRLVTDELILNAITNPPTDTRAYIRGKTLNKVNQHGKMLKSVNWDKINTFEKCKCRTYHLKQKIGLFIENPFENYEDRLNEMDLSDIAEETQVEYEFSELEPTPKNFAKWILENFPIICDYPERINEGRSTLASFNRRTKEIKSAWNLMKSSPGKEYDLFRELDKQFSKDLFSRNQYLTCEVLKKISHSL